MVPSARNKIVLVENVRVADDALIVDCDDGPSALRTVVAYRLNRSLLPALR